MILFIFFASWNAQRMVRTYRTWYGKYAFEQNKWSKIIKLRVQCTVYILFANRWQQKKREITRWSFGNPVFVFVFFFSLKIHYGKIQILIWLVFPFRWWFIWCNLYQPISAARDEKKKPKVKREKQDKIVFETHPRIHHPIVNRTKAMCSLACKPEYSRLRRCGCLYVYDDLHRIILSFNRTI